MQQGQSHCHRRWKPSRRRCCHWNLQRRRYAARPEQSGGLPCRCDAEGSARLRRAQRPPPRPPRPARACACCPCCRRCRWSPRSADQTQSGRRLRPEKTGRSRSWPAARCSGCCCRSQRWSRRQEPQRPVRRLPRRRGRGRRPRASEGSAHGTVRQRTRQLRQPINGRTSSSELL